MNAEQHLVLHGLAIKKYALPDAIASLLGLPEDRVKVVLQEGVARGTVTDVGGKYAVSPAARVSLRSNYGRFYSSLRSSEEFREAYLAFEKVNTDLKALITDWQTLKIGGEIQLFRDDLPGRDLLRIRIVQNDCKIHRCVRQVLMDMTTGGLEYCELGVGILLRELLNDFGEVATGERTGSCDGDAASSATSGHGDLLTRCLHFPDDSLGLGEEELSCMGQRDTPAFSEQQRGTQLFFKQLNLTTQSGLRNVESCLSCRKAAHFRHLRKVEQPPTVDQVLSHSFTEGAALVARARVSLIGRLIAIFGCHFFELACVGRAPGDAFEANHFSACVGQFIEQSGAAGCRAEVPASEDAEKARAVRRGAGQGAKRRRAPHAARTAHGAGAACGVARLGIRRRLPVTPRLGKATLFETLHLL